VGIKPVTGQHRAGFTNFENLGLASDKVYKSLSKIKLQHVYYKNTSLYIPEH